MSQLCVSLPPSYDVENLDDQLKLETVKACLLAEEQKRSGRESSSIAASGSDGVVLNRRDNHRNSPVSANTVAQSGIRSLPVRK